MIFTTVQRRCLEGNNTCIYYLFTVPEHSWCRRAGDAIELVPLTLGHEEVLVVAVVAEAVDQTQKLNLQGHLWNSGFNAGE